MQRIKTYSTLAGVLFWVTSGAQPAYQLKLSRVNSFNGLGIGMGSSHRPSLQVEQGAVPLRPVGSLNIFVDYHHSIRDWLLQVSWGSRVMFSFYKGWWELSREVSYYQPSLSTRSLEKFDQAELFLYLRQQKTLFRHPKFSWVLFGQAGPAFSLNNHLNRVEGLVETRSDNGASFQVCIVAQERRQPVWLPFLRAVAGTDFIFNQRHGTAIAVSAFFEIAALQKDRLRYTTLPGDPALQSSGHFRWNRNQAGFKFSVLRNTNQK